MAADSPNGAAETVEAANEIGVDRWVEQSDERHGQYQGFAAPIRRQFENLSSPWKMAIFVVAAAIFPFLVAPASIRIGITVLLLAIAALGLNVIVGWAGLLDLGYVAFYGFGAYFYAIVASDQIGAHWPTWIAIPIIVVASGCLGILLSLPSRRLSGDYLAIMTLFFAQIFVEVVRNFSRLPFVSNDLDLTGGPNGVTGIEPWDLFGFVFNTFTRQYYLALVFLALLIVGLYNLDRSRTGRAWRALREDPIAAEHMTTPLNRTKMLAFAIGAAIAGLSGTMFAAVQVGVFPNNFSLVFLITVYAAVILGGSGSISGAVLGAVVIAYLPELLRNPTYAAWLFYVALAGTVFFTIRSRRLMAITVAAVAALGFVVRLVAGGIWDSATTGEANDAFLSRLVDDWVLVLGENQDLISSYAFVAGIVGVLLVIELSGQWRVAALVPTIYIWVLVWENKLTFQPSITRQLLFGALLVVMMAVRPQGLLGTRRVEIT